VQLDLLNTVRHNFINKQSRNGARHSKSY